MGIVDVLDFLPENHPDRDSLLEILNKVSSALVSVQDKKTSLWYQVLDMGGDTPLKIVSLKNVN